MNNMYYNQLDFFCDYCDRSFTRKFNLQAHIENCHVNGSSCCNVCDQKFASPTGLQHHMSKGHNTHDEPFPECDICGRVFTRKQNIVAHMITIHLQGVGPEIKCKDCDKVFSTERNLKRHTNIVHNPEMCNFCRKIFKNKQLLYAHLQAEHNGPNTGIKCFVCNKTYSNKRNLKRHIEMYHGEKEDHKCDFCPKVYTSNRSLKRHIKSVHTASEEIKKSESDVTQYSNEIDDNNCMESETEGISCDTCHKLFSDESKLRQHIKTDHSFEAFYTYCKNYLEKQMIKDEKITKQMIYNCEYCYTAFVSVFELKNHMRLNHFTEYSLSTCNVCFGKFYSKAAIDEHKKICLPPPNVNSCSHCDKLFTEVSSLHFHTRIFHPQAQIADSNISSTNVDEKEDNNFKCIHCDRFYYSDRSLKHHIKLKHSTDEIVNCEICGKICSNKYYLASHMKMAHCDVSWSQCDYCDKQFKSKRNVRRHIDYTHLGMQRYKCIECETLFKEKRSLRKHVRSKHPNSALFPQCHICHKRFESAKSCKIHLKLIHSFNMNSYPCDLCSVSFNSKDALKIHLATKHLAEDQIFKCEDCNLVFKGSQKFEQHNEENHVSVIHASQNKLTPCCIICMKDFSTRKSLKRHIKKFHMEFEVEELMNYGSRNKVLIIDCEDCIKNFNDDHYINVYNRSKTSKNTIIFNCDTCKSSIDALEFAVQRQRLNFDNTKSKMVLSELCTTQMSDDEPGFSGFGSLHERMEPESTTTDIKIELHEISEDNIHIKAEPMSP